MGPQARISDVSYAAEAFVFDVQELLLGQLHVQEVLEHQPVPEHGTLRGKQTTNCDKHAKRNEKAPAQADGKRTCCAFPRVRRAAVRGGLRNGRLV